LIFTFIIVGTFCLQLVKILHGRAHMSWDNL